jgi:hypothetical protein
MAVHKTFRASTTEGLPVAPSLGLFRSQSILRKAPNPIFLHVRLKDSLVSWR